MPTVGFCASLLNSCRSTLERQWASPTLQPRARPDALGIAAILLPCPILRVGAGHLVLSYRPKGLCKLARACAVAFVHPVRAPDGWGLPHLQKLQAIYEAGSGSVQEKERALLAEIIAKVNDLFQGEVSDDDQLIYVNNVLKGKLLQSETLAQQAANNTKQQFSNSPHLAKAIVDAVIDAMDAHQTMSQQALGSKRVQEGLRDVLLGPGQLYEALRARQPDV